jgi:hypothetical protein
LIDWGGLGTTLSRRFSVGSKSHLITEKKDRADSRTLANHARFPAAKIGPGVVELQPFSPNKTAAYLIICHLHFSSVDAPPSNQDAQTFANPATCSPSGSFLLL